MAGIFGFFDFTRPGRGVPDPEDAPQRSRIFVFFDIFFRKFWDFIKINLLFNLFNLPVMIIAVIALLFLFPYRLSDEPVSDLLMVFWVSSILICIPVITFGPAQAGLTYVLRNYAREEHAFIWWDFKENLKKNMKQGLIVSGIGLLFVLFFGVAVNFYTYNVANELLRTLVVTFLFMVFILFMMVQIYIYPLMVTFKYSIKQLYRNALLFAAGRFLPNLGILIICFTLITATFLFHWLAGIILYMLITVSTIGFICNFYTYPKLKKFIIDRMES